MICILGKDKGRRSHWSVREKKKKPWDNVFFSIVQLNLWWLIHLQVDIRVLTKISSFWVHVGRRRRRRRFFFSSIVPLITIMKVARSHAHRGWGKSLLAPRFYFSLNKILAWWMSMKVIRQHCPPVMTIIFADMSLTCSKQSWHHLDLRK